MNFDFSFEQRSVRDLTRDFALREIAPRAAEMDDSGEFPYEIVAGLGKLGLMGLPLPVEYGGGGGDLVSYVLVIEELARVDSSVAVTLAASTSLAGIGLAKFGSTAQKTQFLPPMARGEMLGAFALTEPGAGSDAGATQTRALLDGDDWIINGTKVFITNAGTDISGFAIVAAVTGRRQDGSNELSTILVPRGTLGFAPAPPYRKLGWHASDTRELRFEDCRVPRANIVGERGAGFRQFLYLLDGGRIGIAAMGCGLTQGCLDLSLTYALERKQFGAPIFDNQAVQFALADLETAVEMARLMTYKAACLRDAGLPHTREAAMAKLFASETAVRAAEQGVQVHGGWGFMHDNPISRFYRDSKILTIGEGTSEVQRMVIARQMAKRAASA